MWAKQKISCPGHDVVLKSVSEEITWIPGVIFILPFTWKW